MLYRSLAFLPILYQFNWCPTIALQFTPLLSVIRPEGNIDIRIEWHAKGRAVDKKFQVSSHYAYDTGPLTGT